MFSRENSRLNSIQRHAIIIMHQEGHDVDYTSERDGCARSSVYRHIEHYNSTHSFEDDLREGNYTKTQIITRIHAIQ